MKPLFLQIPLTDVIKLPPYSKYMKDIVSNKRKIPNEEISTLLGNYSFNGKVQRNLETQGFQQSLALLRIVMLELLCVIWELELVLCLFLSIRGFN